MAFIDTMPQFAAPGAFGTTNLRAALASARAAAVVSPPPPMPRQWVTPCAFSAVSDPEAGYASGPVTPKASASGPRVSTPLSSEGVVAVDAPQETTVAMRLGSGPAGLLAGTSVETEAGRVPVEEIAIGDRVLTADSGASTVRWVARVQMSVDGDRAPVRFAKNVLRNDRVLVVSPMHRVLISGPEVLRINGTKDALIGAHALVDGRSITRVTGGRATYVLVMLEDHQLMWANNTLVESFYPDLDRLSDLPLEVITDFVHHAPNVADDPDSYGPRIRPVLHDLEAAALETD